VRWSVQNTPYGIRPFIWLYGILGASLIWLFLTLWRKTIRVTFSGDGDRRIDVLWHENLILYFLFHPKTQPKSIWMQHPALYMKPTHQLLHWMGVEKMAFGSTGNGGRAALDEVISFLQEGGSTVITPDGPAGPPLSIKKGVLILSIQTKTPVTPVCFHCSHPIRMPTWDGKIVPRPFSSVRIHCHSAVKLDMEDSRILSDALSHI